MKELSVFRAPFPYAPYFSYNVVIPDVGGPGDTLTIVFPLSQGSSLSRSKIMTYSVLFGDRSYVNLMVTSHSGARLRNACSYRAEEEVTVGVVSSTDLRQALEDWLISTRVKYGEYYLTILATPLLPLMERNFTDFNSALDKYESAL